MSVSGSRVHARAAAMLVLATACWAVSFPVMRVLSFHQPTLLAGTTNSWFLSALGVGCRFLVAGLCLIPLCGRRMRYLTRSEIAQGVGLGIFGSLGMLFQMDGLAHTDASTSAFLTQCYVLVLPLWQSLVERRPPSRPVIVGCAVVVAGVAVLSGMTWRDLRLGRGEIETIIASLFFTGQILWLQRPAYEGNDVGRFTTVMFFVMALCMAPVVAVTAPNLSACWRAYASLPSLTFLALLVGVCTLGGYLLMNHWQRKVTASEAGLIYCSEPVFASLLALILPVWLSRFADVNYPNEAITWRLLVGGGLILVSNLIVQIKVAPTTTPEAA
ncbi:MAG: DMT family transporter [Verrucomicrobiales bacterium]|nr:DMT family transporter [Verrucomicrobiales bacterium]